MLIGKPWSLVSVPQSCQTEMKCLCPDSTPKIQAMEAALYLSFNKHFDGKKPKYCPVILLKF